jgi:hypothetical protein
MRLCACATDGLRPTSGLSQLLGRVNNNTTNNSNASSVPSLPPIGMTNNGQPLTISPSATVDDRVIGASDGASTPTIFSIMQTSNLSAPRSPVLLVGSVGTRRVGFSSRTKVVDGSSNNSTPLSTRRISKNDNDNNGSNGNVSSHKRTMTDDESDLQFSLSLGRANASLLDGTSSDFE